MLAQILVKQGEMGEKLAVISEQLSHLPDHEQRIRSLETFRWKLTGAMILMSFISGAVGAALTHVKFL